MKDPTTVTDAKAESGPGGVEGIAGLFVAGNAAKGLQLAMVAAAEGLKAADPTPIQQYGLEP